MSVSETAPTRCRSRQTASLPINFLLEWTMQLQRALESRIVIEQAKGTVACLIKIDVAEAFEVLRKGGTELRSHY